MPQKLYWKAYSAKDRVSGIQEVMDRIQPYGDVVDVHLFSDLAIALTVEIAASMVDLLYAALSELVVLDEVEALGSSSNSERTILLNLSFSAGTGDLETVRPIGPG